MWNYEKRLEYPVNITTPNPKIAQIIMSQYGGPDGELDDEVLGYWNAVRNRGGVPDIETVYPDVKSDQNLARDLIHRERQVEFAFENIRWFDANRWKIATETNHGKTYGMNVNISSKNALRSEYYQRTAFETRVFLERQYLQPIPQTAIMKNPDLKQNPGW